MIYKEKSYKSSSNSCLGQSREERLLSSPFKLSNLMSFNFQMKHKANYNEFMSSVLKTGHIGLLPAVTSAIRWFYKFLSFDILVGVQGTSQLQVCPLFTSFYFFDLVMNKSARPFSGFDSLQSLSNSSY